MSNETKWTPAPWVRWTWHAKVYQGPARVNTESTFSCVSGDAFCIADCEGDLPWVECQHCAGWDEDERPSCPVCDGEGEHVDQVGAANADLIAAAPDLYAALEALTGIFADGDGAFVAVAEHLEEDWPEESTTLYKVNAARAALAKARGETAK